MVLSRSTIPPAIQATGHVNDQIPANPGCQDSRVEMKVATPTRITNSGQASPHVQPLASRMRKTTPRPMSHVAPVMEPRLADVTVPSSPILG